MIMSDRREHDEYASGVRAELNGSYWLDAPERDGHTQATAAGAKPWRRPKPRRGVAGIPRPVPTDPAPISGGRSRVRHLDTPAGPHPQERPVSTGSHAAAAERPSVIAVGRFAPGRHRSPDQWRGPKDGAVRVTKSLRRSPTAGAFLPPTRPARARWKVSPRGVGSTGRRRSRVCYGSGRKAARPARGGRRSGAGSPRSSRPASSSGEMHRVRAPARRSYLCQPAGESGILGDAQCVAVCSGELTQARRAVASGAPASRTVPCARLSDACAREERRHSTV